MPKYFVIAALIHLLVWNVVTPAAPLPDDQIKMHEYVVHARTELPGYVNRGAMGGAKLVPYEREAIRKVWLDLDAINEGPGTRIDVKDFNKLVDDFDALAALDLALIKSDVI